jgi:hypothetical protein
MSSNDTRRSFIEALVSTVTGFIFAGSMLLTGGAAEASKIAPKYGMKPKPPIYTPKYGIKPTPQPSVKYGIKPAPGPVKPTVKYGIKPKPAVKYGIKPAPVKPAVKYGIKPTPVKPALKYGGPTLARYGL